MKREVRVLLLFAASPALATEPPGAWFLNAHHTGPDPYVYFSVGGSGETPPLAADEVVLGWSWDEAGTPVEAYPGRVPVRYRTSALREKRPRQWREKSSRVGHPPLAVGPGDELLFLGDDDRTTAGALAWADLLDVIEAAYRHSSPDLAPAERRGELVIGLLGECPVLSRPVDGEGPGWAPLSLPGRARPSRAGGFYYVEDARAPAGRVGTVEARRFLRRVEEDGACSGDDLDLRLFPAPRGDRLAYAYSLIWKDADVLSVGFLDLEPEPMTPAVRRVAGRARPARSERVNVGRWPDEGRDLCRDPVVGELCRRDLAIRRRLATSLGPAGLPAARERCRRLLRDLGAGGDPCSDPEAWSSESGLYSAGYRGDLPLAADRLESRWETKGAVAWRWLHRAPGGPVDFGLADGTRIHLSLPDSPPAGVRPPAAAHAPLLSRRETEPEPRGAATSIEATPADASDRSDRSDRSDTLPETAPPPSAAPSPKRASAADPLWPVKGLQSSPKLLIGGPALLFVLLAIRRLRRSASRSRPRTSYVLKVRTLSPPRGATSPSPEESFADLPLVPSSEPATPLDLVPAVDSWDVDPDVVPRDDEWVEPPVAADPKPPPAAVEEEAAREWDEGPELLRALEGTRRLAEWVASVLPAFRDIEEARGVIRFESLPLPARREWIDAYDTLRRFAKSYHGPLPGKADEPRPSSKERLRGDLLAPDGHVHGAVLALQYLLEAFPVEQLDARERKAYKTAVRERLEAAGITPRFHHVAGDAAETMGLAYRPVRYYKNEIGEAGFELLDDAYDRLSLSERVGYEAGTERPVVVRLTELFLVDAATGAPFSGRAAIDGVRSSTPGRFG